MIGYIKGFVTEIGEDTLFIENRSGFAMELQVSNKTISFCKNNNDEVKLYYYIVSREEGISTFGFYSKEEKDIFLQLITVSSVGPKAAISILSSIDINELVTAIRTQNIKMLTAVKGIGKKTAERIVLELKEKFSDSGVQIDFFTPIEEESSMFNDAVNTLVDGLGFSRQEAVRAVKMSEKQATSLEELVRLALQVIR
ncbi:MAG: Holliday junction branch migration protein RuvA [Clostridia bacterium]|nr:Holliday junction branch migration protein RuvA [Clostridia bacterium]